MSLHNYQLKRSACSKRVTMRLTPTGQLVVSAPLLMPKLLIDHLINSRREWLEEQIAKILAKKQRSPSKWYVFGKPYELTFGFFANLPSGWQLQGKKLIYNNSKYAIKPKKSARLSAAEQQAWQAFAKNTLANYINARIRTLHKQMKIKKKINRVCIKNQQTCWGSCSSLMNLNFNLQLIHCPPAVIDYILIHELAHLVHLNHSPKFWALVAKHDGNYKLHQRQLSKFS